MMSSNCEDGEEPIQMNTHRRPSAMCIGAALLATLLFAGCRDSSDSDSNSSGHEEPVPEIVATEPSTVGFLAPPGATANDDEAYPELDWLDLMPDAEREALLRGEWPENDINHDLEGAMDQVGSDAVVAALDGREVTLPGYVVPLELAADGKMRSFFLVPYYGACIHVPPPPPNQIIYADLTEPTTTPDLWEPMRMSGTLRTVKIENDLANSAYRMDEVRLTPWE